MSSAITYNEHRIDEISQIIVRVLRDVGLRATAGELRSEAGLDETNPIHYRVNHHLDPAGLVERAGRKRRPGGAQDEVIYELTENGVAFVDANQDDLTNAVASAEAVETFRRMHARVDSYEERVADVEQMVQNWQQWKNRWSTRVGRIQDDIEDLGGNFEQAKDQRNKIILARKRNVNRLDNRIDEIDDRINELVMQTDSCENRLESLESAIKERPTTEQVDEGFKNLQTHLSTEIDDIREEAEGFW